MYCTNDIIKIFPIGFDRTSDPGARALSERNLRFLIRSNASTSSFVITDSYDCNSEFEFVIEGYYIKLKDTKLLSDSFRGNDIYATIFIDENEVDSPKLCGKEEAGEFTGVIFSTSLNPESIYGDGIEKYSLKILTWNEASDSYKIPDESKHFSLIVDGGEIK